jgi:hypothetical protein
MPISSLAGKPAPKDMLIDPARLEREYFDRRPDPSDPNQLVSFGTSGHRGTPLNATFTEAHILAITQAICDYRRGQGTDGPLYMGKDTHAVSAPAHARGWRLQVQPDQRRPRRHGRHEVGPGPGQRTAARRKQRREARAVRHGRQGRDHAPGRLRPALRQV